MNRIISKYCYRYYYDKGQLGLWKFIERNEIEQFKDLIIKQIYLRNDVNYNRQDILKKSISKSTMKI
ncbi:hypothetical protein RCL_jg29223.t2 [Rhizophagus clarus]|uniref:Uncharacterized protein n=1 Tax=Rhizophagus clarus TaxID=94130 RepID=A0A8H3M8K7_9GLOM|nr:hypothetical protein RCL_jg29223.t2 [Rhizophagus clarus]